MKDKFGRAIIEILTVCAVVITASVFKYCHEANEPKVVRFQIEIVK